MYFMTVPQWYDPDAVSEIAEKHYGLKNMSLYLCGLSFFQISSIRYSL